MSQQTIELSGIVRNLPDNRVPDGSMQELINLRPRDGALRPVGAKSSVASVATDVRFIHRINDNLYAIIGTDGNYLKYWVYASEVLVYTGMLTMTESDDMRFAALKNSLMVSNNVTETTVLLVFDDETNTYNEFTELIPDIPFIHPARLADGATHTHTFDFSLEGNKSEAEMSEYVKMQKEKAEDGYLSGYVLMRFAWELFDGTIAKHTLPVSIQASTIATTGSVVGGYWQISTLFTPYKLQYWFKCNSAWWTEVKDKYKNIVKSLNIYITRPRSPEVIETGESLTVKQTPDVLKFMRKVVGARRTSYDVTYDVALLSNYIPDMDAETQYYLLKSLQLSDVVINVVTDIVPDNETVLDLEMRDQMTVDNFTHHTLHGKSLFGYNDRIFLGNIKNTLYQGFNLASQIFYAYANTGPAYSVGIEFDIIVGGAIKTVFTGWYEINYYNASAKPYFNTMPYIGYPDARAKTARFFVKDPSSIIRLVSEKKLHPINAINISWATSVNIHGTDFTDYVATPLSANSNYYWDNNRIQATEINNPFYFPAINSYRIGNSEILGMSSNARALSQGQFGQFPVICFTSEGIWTMNIGTEETLISTITPISREVCNNPDSITPIDGAVVFTTSKGLFLISGVNVTELSETAEGDYLGRLAGNLNYEAVINNPILYQVKPFICTASLVTYLSGAKIAWDQSLQELIVSNMAYSYSWVFSIKYKAWFKISQTWTTFVTDYPKTYGYNFPDGTYKQFNMSEEDLTDYITVHFETRPLKLSPRAFKKLNRLLIQGYVNDSSINQFSIALFGTPDNINWYLFNNANTFGSKSRLLIGRSTFSCRYFILIVGGKVDDESYFTSLDVDFEERYHNKLR